VVLGGAHDARPAESSRAPDAWLLLAEWRSRAGGGRRNGAVESTNTTGGVDRGGSEASEDLAGETWGRRVCVGERREEGERETARAQSVTVGVAFSPVRWLTQGSGDVVGPAWQWAVGRV